jgi:hypothetical protein
MLHSSKSVGVLGAILLCAAGALAQSGTPVTNSYDAAITNQVTVNQCSIGEPVALDGVLHVSYSVTTDSSGVNQFTVTAANDVTGSGQKTGIAYAASDSADYNSNTTDSSADMTVELKSDLKPQGSAPGLTLVQSLRIVVDTSGNVSAQVVSSTTGCGS